MPRTKRTLAITVAVLGMAVPGCRRHDAAPRPPETESAPVVEATPLPEAVDPPDRVDPARDLDARVERVMQAYAVPGLALAVVKDGEVITAKGDGVRERGKDGAVDADTVFAIASNTKAFVATTLAMLEHDKVLDLDDRVKDRLPWFTTWDPCTTKEMRVRDLVTHRSGLARWAGDLMWIGSDIDTRSLLAKLRHLPAGGLRESYGYSNLMFVVGGEVIRAVTGRPWDEVVEERLLVPIGMTRTSTKIAALAGLTNVATPHAKHGDADVVDGYLSLDDTGAAGALNSSAADMAKWLQVQLGNGRLAGEQIVPEEVLLATRVPHTPVPLGKNDPLGRHFQAYGLGWFLHDYRGRTAVTHGGGLPGMTSRVMMVPEANVGVVVLTNSESPASLVVALDVIDGMLGGTAVDHLAGFQARAREAKAKAEAKADAADENADAGTSQPLSPARIRGVYRNPLLGRAEVTLDAGTLHLRLPDHGGLDCPLEANAGAVFRCAWSNAIFGESNVRFDARKDGKGKATALRFEVRPEFIDPLEYTFTR